MGAATRGGRGNFTRFARFCALGFDMALSAVANFVLIGKHDGLARSSFILFH
jgi:hypothetical protein